MKRNSLLVYNQCMSGKRPLPKSLRPYFWDYSFSSLSLLEDKELIIRRLLTNGSWDTICWLRKQIGDQELRDWLLAHKGRGLSPRQLRFWGVIYELPARRVNGWVRDAQNGVWKK